jgi:soluble lytic murein transglycosylase-like protein
VVRAFLIVICLLSPAGAARAQGVDWRAAGGDLFATANAATAAQAAPEDVAPRLPVLRQPYMEAIAAAADRHGLDPKLLHALVLVESAYRPDAVSIAGAAGLTQLMPGAAAELGVEDRFDPLESLSGGADYLARQVLRFGDLKLALAAYNAGPARVAARGRIPEIRETQAYVATVVDCYLALSAGRRVRSARECRSKESAP